MHENKSVAIQLCDKDFLDNFNPDFLALYDLNTWDKSMGSRDRLNLVKEASVDAILIDSSLSYNSDSLLCWGAALKTEGYLILESIDHCNPKMLADNLTTIFKYQSVSENSNIWILRKKALINKEFLVQNLHHQLANNTITDYRVQNALNQLEQCYPYDDLAPYTRSQIYNMQELTEAAVNSWNDYFFRNPQRNKHYFTIMHRLISGDYYHGFKQRELFYSDHHSIRSTIPPSSEILNKRWQGEPLFSKRLIVWSEFGFGDEIMFSQLAHYLKSQQPKQLIFIVQPPIVDIIKSHPDIDIVISSDEWHDQHIEFDYWVYPHSILAHVTESFDTLPKRIPYLFANPVLITKMAQHINKTDGLKIGLAWRGSPHHENDNHRSIHELTQIESLLTQVPHHWYCLQKDLNEAERKLMERYQIPLIGPICQNFSDTAAAIANLDLVVTVDTSIAHLAGAMNIPTFLMLSFITDWRWGFKQTNLWYPSIRAFHQRSPLIYWPTVIGDVIEAIKQFASK